MGDGCHNSTVANRKRSSDRELIGHCNSKPILCSVIEDSAPVLSSRSAKTDLRDENIEVRCGVPTCNLIFNITKIRHHSAWHIKYDKDLSSKVGGILVTNLCGICASGKATTYTKDAPDGVCSAWLEKVRGAKTMHFKHTCRKHPIAKVKSYAAALTPSKANPSTNVPIECPECSHLGGKGRNSISSNTTLKAIGKPYIHK